MSGWLLIPVLVVLVALVYAAIGRYDADNGPEPRNRRQAEPGTMRSYGRERTPVRGVGALWLALRSVLSDIRELQQRRALFDRPWEEEFLHWAHDGQDWHLHGHLVPSAGRRSRSVTSRGWCPGHATAKFHRLST
jgi:hypothetical protein